VKWLIGILIRNFLLTLRLSYNDPSRECLFAPDSLLEGNEFEPPVTIFTAESLSVSWYVLWRNTF